MMKNKFITIGSALFLFLILGMSFISGAQQMQQEKAQRILNYFFDGKNVEDLSPENSKKMGEYMTSIYSDLDMDVSETVDLFNKTMNEKFNEYVEKMMSNIDKSLNKPNSDEALNGKAPNGKDFKEDLSLCKANNYANYSTYCVALVLYSDPDFGYVMFRDLLKLREYDIYIDNNPDKPLFADVAMQVSMQSEEVETALVVTKQALNQTLSAYDQLRSSFLMHKRYVAIYDSLLKYRDYLVDMRHFIEKFPAKFIDASTTKCT